MFQKDAECDKRMDFDGAICGDSAQRARGKPFVTGFSELIPDEKAESWDEHHRSGWAC